VTESVKPKLPRNVKVTTQATRQKQQEPLKVLFKKRTNIENNLFPLIPMNVFETRRVSEIFDICHVILEHYLARLSRDRLSK